MHDLPPAKTIIEPFRIKSVEPIRFLSASERARVVQTAGYNLFKVPAQNVTFRDRPRNVFPLRRGPDEREDWSVWPCSAAIGTWNSRSRPRPCKSLAEIHLWKCEQPGIRVGAADFVPPVRLDWRCAPIPIS